MESIARLMVASTDLLEAEGRAFKRQLGRVAMAAGLAVLALALALAGLGLLLAGLFMLIAQYLGGPGVAALVFGVVAIAIAGVGVVSARKYFAQ
jgi:hypothetical protein